MATRQAERMRGQEMPKAYEPRAVEAAIYDFWESRGYFAPSVPPKDREEGAHRRRR